VTIVIKIQSLNDGYLCERLLEVLSSIEVATIGVKFLEAVNEVRDDCNGIIPVG